MDKLLIKYMENPSAENRKKLLAHADKHSMPLCFLTPSQAVIFNQIKREAA